MTAHTETAPAGTPERLRKSVCCDRLNNSEDTHRQSGFQARTSAKPGVPLDYLNELELRWLLLRHDVPDTALMQPGPVRAGHVRFLASKTHAFSSVTSLNSKANSIKARRVFDFDEAGERALVFIEDHDLIAWQPRTGQLASWRGVAFALGESAIWNPASWFMGGGLKVHRTPLEWLKDDRRGICIVRRELTYAMLKHVPRLVFADAAHARQVKRWLQPPQPRAEIMVEIQERVAA